MAPEPLRAAWPPHCACAQGAAPRGSALCLRAETAPRARAVT